MIKLLPSAHVTAETGTGFVHIAPNHGVEDFELGKKFNIKNCSVDEKVYTPKTSNYSKAMFINKMSL